jgi:hypothetical protein
MAGRPEVAVRYRPPTDRLRHNTGGAGLARRGTRSLDRTGERND